MTPLSRRAPLTPLVIAVALTLALLPTAWIAQAQSDLTAPSNLTAEVVEGVISLSWDAPTEDSSSVTDYQVPRSHAGAQLAILKADAGSTVDDETISSLVDSHVQYTVPRDGYTIRAATKSKVDAHYDASRPSATQTPERDLTVTEITALSEIEFDDWDTFGVKAANVAVLGTMDFPDGTVPDGFAVPFYFYDEFMKANELVTMVSTMLADSDFQTNFDTQETKLKELRSAIEGATTPNWIITALEEMRAEFPEGTSLRYRSSTNNEGLPGFSGAGLYDSKTQDPDETEEDGIDKSIKGVWASLWNFRAFVEREFHRIDHGATAMGVLVHPNYSDELANGVAISHDPIGGRAGAYYVNTQIGEDLVTNPEALSVPEELLLLSDGSYEVLVRSNQVESEQLLMSDAQMEQLRGHLTIIHDKFEELYDPAEDERFAMEVEFKITSDDVLAIKQARPWVFRPINEPRQFPSTETRVRIRGTGPFTTEPSATLTFTRQSVSVTRDVAENTAAGVAIGEPVTATDVIGTVTYTLGGTDAESFDIVAATGQLQTKAALDYETKSSYEVTVTATDSEGSVDIMVTINVTNIVEVSVEAGTSPVTEGADATFTLTRDGPLTAELTVNVTVEETGSMLSSGPPASATFEADASTTTLTVPTEDDTPVEDPSTVTATITSGSGYQAEAGAESADVVVLDDLPRFVLRVGPEVVTEGGGGAVSVEITNGVTFTTAQTISLALGGTATADDFTLLNTSDGTLSAPYTLTIPANEGVAAAYISTVNDALPEPAETLTITASHDGTDIGTGTMTLRASSLRLELSSLAASGGGGRAMYPAFDPGTLHYAVGCDPAQTLTLRLSTTDATTRLAVNGIQQVNQNAVVALNQLDGDDDILIALSNAAGASTTYIVHCMNSSDPYIEAEKRPGSSTELISISTNLSGVGHLFVVDPNGVPRVHRRVVTPRVNHFRPQDHPDFAYSYAQILPEPFQSPWGLRRDFEIVILDRDFNEVRRVTTTDAIPNTDQHDFLIKQNGNFIFMSYTPVEHDLSEFVDHHGNPYGTQPAEDSLIEEVTPEGNRVFFWSTYDHVYLGDCMEQQFPANYAHLNSLQLVGGDLVISLRNCSQVLRIDGTTGEVQWRLGSSNRSDAEWEALGLQPPLQIIGDPYVEFCGQHSAKLMPNGHLLLYDNGWNCRPDPATGLPRRPDKEFSRAVEYALDLDRGTATFVRHHSLHHSFSFFNPFQGIVAPLENDSWLVSWGSAVFNSDSPPDTTATEYNFKTDQELLSLWLKGGPAEPLRESRAYPLGFEALEQQAEPLAAAWPESAQTSVFTFGQTDTPTVVVAFSEPVVDFAADTPSVSVIGAAIASVAAHVMPGEPANAYLFTLTPDGDGSITLRLFADQSCASGDICTADGARLSEVPGTYTIEAPVRVSFEQTSFTASEGESALIVVSLSAPSGPFGITIPIVVTGGTASADEYSAPESVVFSSGSDRQTVSIPLGDDALIEGDETIALAFGDLPTGVTPGTNSTTTVTITDADSAAFGFAISDDEVGEGAIVELTLTLDGVATFAAAQTIDLTFQGGGATSGVDFTVTDSRGQTLTAPYALTLPAGSSSVVATISIVDDAEEEGNETIVVSVSHEAVSLGVKVITILANDAPPPPTNSPPVFTEGRSAARSLAENTGPSITIGRPLAATDVDPGDTLFYSLGGPDAGSFDISLTSGQLRTKSGIVYDHEARSSYRVTVTVSDGQDTATIDVDITVTDEDEPPDAPVVQVDTASPVSLNVRWLAPATSGRPAVRDYDLRYKLDSEKGFIDGPQDVSGTSASIGELIPASSYDVQVRATNAEGDGPWSGSQPGETAVLPAVTLILSESSIPENRGMSTVTATVSPASPTPFSVEIWAAAFPPIPGQFETSLNTILSFAANATQSTGEVMITGLVPAVVNVTGTVSPPDANVRPPARVQLRITGGDIEGNGTGVTSPPSTGGGGGGGSEPAAVPEPPVGYLENPGPNSFQSGIGVLSGWVCAADEVTLELNGVAHRAAYGTARLDTAAICGDTDNGFGLLFNWNLLGDGEHEVVAFVDGVELARATVTVKTLRAEFLRGVAGTCTAADFPRMGETVTLAWQQNSQNFVIAGGRPPAGATTGRASALTGFLENPGPNSFQSGIGVLSGWVCAAETVEIEITTEDGAVTRHVAAYGTERLDTQDACGDTNNGFGLLFNWNLLGDGEHTVVAYVDDEELGRATVRVTTLGQEFVKDVAGMCVVAAFSLPGETVTLRWQQNSQNFVITDVK